MSTGLRIWGWLAGFALLIILTQTGSMTREVIGWDESTFALLGEDIRDGILPYVERFDNKPPLIFFLMAGSFSVFGENLVAVRLLGDLSLLISAGLVFAILLPRYGGLAAGLVGVACIAIHATQIAHFTSAAQPATAFVMVALWALLNHRDRLWGVALAGAMISLAVLTRSNLAYLAVAVGLFLVLRSGGRRWLVLPYTLAGLMPLGAILGVYAAAGALDVFKLATVDVALNYAGGGGQLGALRLHLWLWGQNIFEAPLVFGGFTALLGAGLIAHLWPGPGDRSLRADWGIIWLFLLVVCLSILNSGAAYSHYWQQILPLAALFIGPLIAWVRGSVLAHGGVCVIVLGMIGAGISREAPGALRVLFMPSTLQQAHVIAQAAREVAAVRAPGDRIWALDRHLILFYLDAPTVSRVVGHPSNITRTAIMEPLVAAGYVPEGELQRLYDSQPEFLVTAGDGRPFYLKDKQAFEVYAAAGYHRFFTAPDILVFRRNDHPSAE